MSLIAAEAAYLREPETRDCSCCGELTAEDKLEPCERCEDLVCPECLQDDGNGNLWCISCIENYEADGEPDHWGNEGW